MTAEDTLADQAESEIHDALSTCESEGYSKERRDELWQVFKRWLHDPRLLADTCQLRVTILNELTFRLGDEQLKKEAWIIFRELARKYSDNDPEGMGSSLIISTFEVFAEPPEVPRTLRLLFSLADEPETRWAVFAAYENYPWRLRPHASKYSSGMISDADCDNWLRERRLGDDEYLMPNRSEQDVDPNA